MPRASEITKDNFTFLIYGPSRSGKTHLEGTLGSRNLIVNIGQGISTILSTGFKKLHPNVDPYIETIYEEAIPKKASGYDSVCLMIDKYLAEKSEEIDAITIDDLTALRRFGMMKGAESNDKYGLSESWTKMQRDKLKITTQQDYNAEMNLMEQFIVGTMDLCRLHKKHLVLSAHDRYVYGKPSRKGDEAPLIKVLPGFTGKTHPDQLTGLFDCVFRLECLGAGIGRKYFAYTIGDEKRQAGSRWSGLFPERWENPDLLKAIEAIKTGKEIRNA